jgi:uncharacterized protein (TIGR03435 family)
VNVNATAGGRGAEVSDGQGGKQKMSMTPDGKSMRLENSRMEIAAFAELLNPFVDRPVVDMTELKGFYQVWLEIPMSEVMALARKAGQIPAGVGGGEGGRGAPAEAASDPTGGSIFNNVQQLGLKLEARKAPIAQIVIDRVEKLPSEN